ncbi:MAG: S24 family peptidase [archaeon]
MKKEEVSAILHRKNITKISLARLMGMSRQGLEYHLAGEGDVKPVIAEKILEITGLTSNWEDEEQAIYSKGHFYPLVDTNKVTPDNIITLAENMPHNQFFKYNSKLRCFCITAVGDSMQTQGWRSISDGDILFIDGLLDVMNGDIAFVILNNSRKFVRVFYCKDGELTLKPLNPAYPEVRVRKEEVAFAFRVLFARSRDREL